MMTRLREEASHTDTYNGLLDYMQNTCNDANQMECIPQNSMDKQRHRGVAPSPEPECTERSAAPLRHESTSISRSYHREFTDETTITRQDKSLTVKKIQRPAREKHEVSLLGTVGWCQKTPNSWLRSCAHLNAPTLLRQNFVMFYIHFVSLFIFHYFNHVTCYF